MTDAPTTEVAGRSQDRAIDWPLVVFFVLAYLIALGRHRAAGR